MKTDYKTWLYIAILLLTQLIFNNYINWGTYIMISVFPVIIMLLPYRIYTIQTLVTAFFTGLLIDLLGNGVLGLFAGSITIAALFRQALLKLISDKQSWENRATPDLYELGPAKFTLYTVLFYLIFHLSYYILENMGFSAFGDILAKIIISTAINTPIALILTALYQRIRN